MELPTSLETAIGVTSGIPHENSVATKMEEQMAALMVRIDKRLLDLARQQSEQLQDFHTEMGEWQMTLKQKLCEEILQELTALHFSPWQLRLCHQLPLMVWLHWRRHDGH